MKKEAPLLLIAGIVFGSLVGFVLTREYYIRRMEAVPSLPAPAREGSQTGPQASQAGPEDFNPQQHGEMISQFMEKAKEPGNIEAKVILGNIYYDRGDFAKAASWYEESLKLNEKDTNVLVDLGVCYRNQGRLDEALKLFEKALALDPKKKEALFNQVVVYGLDRKDRAKADQVLKQLKALFPDDPRIAELEAEVEKKK